LTILVVEGQKDNGSAIDVRRGKAYFNLAVFISLTKAVAGVPDLASFWLGS
jgi:hypothetical protein